MTTTTNKGYTVPTVGGDFGTWGTELNSNLSIQDNNVGGVASVSVAGNTDVTANAAQAQCMLQNLTGVLTGNINYILPNAGSYYAIANNTTGSFNIFAKTVSGSGVYVAQGSSTWVYSDGTNIVQATPKGWQEIATYTLSGSSSQVIPLPSIFQRFKLSLQNGSVSVAAAIQLQFSGNSGVSYINANYVFVALNVDSSGIITPSSSTNAGALVLIGALSSTASAADFEYSIYPGTGATKATVRGTAWCFDSGSAFVVQQIAGNQNTTVGPMDHIAITPTAGTMSGTLILEGLP